MPACRAGRVVIKAELFDCVWPGRAVTDSSLTRAFSDVRAAIGREGHRVIQTAARRGNLVVAAPLVATVAIRHRPCRSRQRPNPPNLTLTPCRSTRDEAPSTPSLPYAASQALRMDDSQYAGAGLRETNALDSTAPTTRRLTSVAATLHCPLNSAAHTERMVQSNKVYQPRHDRALGIARWRG